MSATADVLRFLLSRVPASQDEHDRQAALIDTLDQDQAAPPSRSSQSA